MGKGKSSICELADGQAPFLLVVVDKKGEVKGVLTCRF